MPGADSLLIEGTVDSQQELSQNSARPVAGTDAMPAAMTAGAPGVSGSLGVTQKPRSSGTVADCVAWPSVACSVVGVVQVPRLTGSDRLFAS